MGPGPGGFRNSREKMIEKLKEPKPEKFSEIPGYLRRVTTKFLHRLFYIFMLVWETKPWILFFMVFMAVWNGVTPVISSIIGKELLNSLASAYTSVTQGLENKFDTVIMLLVIRFGFNFITGMVSRLSNILNNIANELVVNHINLKIMYKAREVDLASFDLPEFYERFENAKREAGSRPIQILNNNFTIISTVISMLSFIIILGAISPFAPLVIAGVSIPAAVINFTYRKKNFWYVRRHSKDRRQMSYYSEIMTNKDMVKEVRLFNEPILVQAEIHNLEGFSGHADQAGLLDWLGGFQVKPKEIFLVHGEPQSKIDFAAKVKEVYGYDPIVVNGNTEYELETGEILSQEAVIQDALDDEDIEKLKDKLENIQGELDDILASTRGVMAKKLSPIRLQEINNMVLELEKASVNLGATITAEDRDQRPLTEQTAQ